MKIPKRLEPLVEDGLIRCIYTLRNQLVHGGATWHSVTNREQVRDCAAFMAQLVPTIITLLMDHPQHMWPAPAFPVVEL
jgi:hypothetical protein